jgi:hypothetical protein
MSPNLAISGIASKWMERKGLERRGLCRPVLDNTYLEMNWNGFLGDASYYCVCPFEATREQQSPRSSARVELVSPFHSQTQNHLLLGLSG